MAVTQRAFTTLELIISLGIVSILLVLSLASYAEIVSNHLPQQHLKLIKKTLNLARSQAILSDEFVTVCPIKHNKCHQDHWHDPISVFIDKRPHRAFGPQDRTLMILDGIPSPHTLTYPRRAIIFKVNGAVKGFSNGTFVYCIPKKAGEKQGLELTVSMTGRSRLRATKKCKI